ncbi:MAG: 16S rRNA (adenine(1518)-N(6)/adenine(1519)-N(6))-dimethyltransferase RsmA [Patescibacteria group bacterium]
MEKLGQHFLINKNKIDKIIDALELKPKDTIIEIGPGHGELTLPLARNFQFLISNFQIIAVEKDKKLAENLKRKFASEKNIKIINDDILKILSKVPKSYILNSKSYKIVGNIPYYITGYLLRIIGELTASPQRGESRPKISGRKNKPSLIVLTIQKEVAERIVAKPPKMNLLAASVQFWAKPEIIDYIPKKDFRPAPKVDSAIIKLTPKTKTQNLTPKTYYSFIKFLFKQPRKTIMNNLEFRIKNLELRGKNKQKLKQKLLKIGINPQDRPQNLSVEKIKQLSKTIKV